jgi:catechol 2,3-dioxygenase-like lactoylglutathione lyase family enzyme
MAMSVPKDQPKITPQAGRDSQPSAAGSSAPTSTADADAGAAPSATLPDLCSGCAQETRDTMDMKIHLHHVHLNVKNREQSRQFYEKHFHAERVLLNGTSEALHVAPTLILMDEQPDAPDSNLPTALQHMGWGAADTGAWYEAAHAQGISPDTRGFTLFNTNETPTIGDPGSGAIIALSGEVPACFPVPDVAAYMYVLGPDLERIEIWSGADGRVNHMHFTTADLAATSSWYQKFLGLPSMTPLLSYQFFLDDILFFYEPIGAAADYKPTDDHALGHVALAVADLDAWRMRVQQQNIEVVSERAAAHGFMSFFVRGPDGLLIELVQAAKSAELCPP